MFLGSGTYALYVAANIHENRYLLFASAAVMGFGAALLWVAQGSFINQCSHEYEAKYALPKDSQLGYYMGFFWAWMTLNQLVGNSIAAGLFYADISTTTVYVVFTSINVCGVCLFLLIKPFESASNEGIEHQREGASPNVGVQSALLDENDLSAHKFDKDNLAGNGFALKKTLSLTTDHDRDVAQSARTQRRR